MTTVDEVNSDKTKVPDKFIFQSVLLACSTAGLLIHNQCTSLHVSLKVYY